MENTAVNTSDDVIAQAVAQIEAQDEATEAQAAPKKAKKSKDKGLLAAIDAVEDDAITAGAQTLVKAFEAREAYEKAKTHKDPTTIVRKLDKCRARLVQGRSVATLIATQTSADFMNGSVRNGAAFNIYAIEKFADIVNCLANGVMQNAINNAICRSLFQFRAAGVPFTGEAALAAASDKVRVPVSMQKLLVRHNVDAGTAPTQKSSTMRALVALGIVTDKGTQRAPLYVLTDSAATKRMEDVLYPKAA
jgi:hypothetical protein